MLDFVRKHSRSWGVKVLLWLVIIVFVGWGGYLYQTRHESDIARVGDHYVSYSEFNRVYNNLVESMRKQFGGSVPDEVMRSMNIKEQALQSIVEHYLIMKGADELGLEASTGEVRRKILEIPVFQAEGKFDVARYEGLLRQNRMTPDVFEEQMRDEITVQKVQAFVRGRAVVTESEILAQYHFDRDQAKIAYVAIDPKAFEGKVAIQESELQTFYKNHQDRYMEPEKRQIAYALIGKEDLEKGIHPSGDEIKRFYDDNVVRFTSEKRVRAQHVLFRVKPDAPNAEVEKVRAQAQKVLEEAKQGKDFAELAKKYSQDEGTAKKGGELGFFTSKQMEPAFSGAAFALKPGEISDLVKTPYGFHIIKSEEVAEAKTSPIEEVKGEIERELKAQSAQDIAYKQASNLRDLAYARKDVDKAAREMKIAASDPVWIDVAEDQPGLGPFPKQIKAKLFKLSEGEISDILELPNGLAVAQLKSIKKPQPIPFENVQDKVKADFRIEKAGELAKQRATEILAQSKEKNSLADVAKAQKLNVKQSDFFSRQAPDKDLKMLGGFGLNSIFSLGETNPFPESPLELDNSYIVCRLEAKKAAGEPSQAEKDGISGKILRQKQTAVWEAWLTDMRQNTRVEKLKEI